MILRMLTTAVSTPEMYGRMGRRTKAQMRRNASELVARAT
jgi:hypothetical protein